MTRDTCVFVCAHVMDERLPILYVSHDGDGTWQFLCGGAHENAEPKLVCLEELVDRDPTLNEVADLRCNHSAEREQPGGEWQLFNEGEAKLHDDIAQHGWHVIIVSADDEGPGFAYSVGMKETLGHPEIIMFGLTGDLMHALINDLGAMIRGGKSIVPGEPIADLVRDENCIALRISDENRREFLRYACKYYDGSHFDALQCFWPSKQGKFPWESGCDEATKSAQPDLREAS